MLYCMLGERGVHVTTTTSKEHLVRALLVDCDPYTLIVHSLTVLAAQLGHRTFACVA